MGAARNIPLIKGLPFEELAGKLRSWFVQIESHMYQNNCLLDEVESFLVRSNRGVLDELSIQRVSKQANNRILCLPAPVEKSLKL